MSTQDVAKAEGGAAEGAAGGKGRKKLLLLGAPLLLAGLGGGVWASGLIGGGGHGEAAGHHEAAAAGEHGAPARPAAPPVFLDMPDIVANLNTGNRRASYVKLRSKLELSRPEDAAAVQASMPRLLDLFTTYLREMRPEELRGSAGTWRLREELLARANVAAAPARITDVLFLEILQQ